MTGASAPRRTQSCEYSTGYGELTKVTLPLGGSLRGDYGTAHYSYGKALREVRTRYLKKDVSAPEATYTIAYTTGDWDMHNSTCIHDLSGSGQRCWFFNFGNSGLASSVESRLTAGGPALNTSAYTWGLDAWNNRYLQADAFTLDNGLSTQQQSRVDMTQDGRGNVTQTKLYHFGASTPTKTYNVSVSSSLWGSHLWNRLQTGSVTDGTNTITTFSNTYDSGSLTARSGLTQFDTSVGSVRGNVTSVSVPGAVRNFTYDVTGMLVAADDGQGHSIGITPASGKNNTVPGTVTPNGNALLATSYTWNAALQPLSVAEPNANASLTYDANGFPQTGISVHGATTTYSFSGNTITATTNGRWVRTTLDGLGRTVKVERGDASGTRSIVDYSYDAVAALPAGALKTVTRPYAPGGTVYTTTYGYDGVGRVTSISQPNGFGTYTRTYSGNTVTITDPAGKWKKQTFDALGRLVKVTEPNPAGGQFETYYAYDLLDRLKTVTMTRGGVTQTRTWNYDPTTQRLTSMTTPEAGTVSFTYNTDGTVATATDAKGQKKVFTYDTLARLTQVARLPNGVTEDTCQRTTFWYDTNPHDAAYSQNAKGRLTAMQYGGTSCTGATLFTEMVSYTGGGRVTGQRMRLNRGNNNADLNAAYSWDNEGKLTGFTYPNGGTSFTYGYDTLARPVTLTDASMQQWVNGVTWSAADELTAMSQWNGSAYWAHTQQFNALGQLTRRTVGSVLDVEYRFSATQNNGRITSFKDNITGQEVNYSYDSLNRLTLAETVAATWGNSFSFDGFGNLLSKTVTKGSAPSMTLSIDSATNRISSAGFGHDANGNVTSAPGSMVFGFDVENRITNYNSQEFYWYNPANKRVWKKKPDNSEEIFFYGIDGRRMGTYQPVVTGGVLSLNTLSTDLSFAGVPLQLRGQAVAVERLGSVRVSGATTSQYFPWGEEQSATSDDRDKFGTYFRDGTTGLDYADQRYFGSQWGRCLTPDPAMAFGGGLTNPTEWNRYAYVAGDPVNFGDPSGLAFWDFLRAGFEQITEFFSAGWNGDPAGGSAPIDAGFTFHTTAYAFQDPSTIRVDVTCPPQCGSLAGTIDQYGYQLANALAPVSNSAPVEFANTYGPYITVAAAPIATTLALETAATSAAERAGLVALGEVTPPLPAAPLLNASVTSGAPELSGLFLPDEYYASRLRRAPTSYQPYGIYERFWPNGDLRQVTTYDQFGDRIRQFDVGRGARHGEGFHEFYYDLNYPRQFPGGGLRSDHIPFE